MKDNYLSAVRETELHQKAMKEKIKSRNGFIPIPLLVGIIFSLLTILGVTYGAIEYNKTSKIIKEAEQLSKEEKYDESIGKLEVAQNKLLGKIILKQKISTELDTNKKLLVDKTKYDEGVNKLNEGGLQGSIDLLSELPESSFYYQKAQTKIEESKRKIVEGKLSKETTAKLAAEAKAKQEELEKNIKEQQLSKKEAEEKRMSADNDGDGLTYGEELSKGTSDLNLDSDGDGIIDSKDAHPTGGGRNIAQTFAWNYGGNSWTWTESIQEDWYEYYKAKPRSSPESVEYITSDDPFIKKISKRISDSAKGDIGEVWLAVSFVQSLPYVEDVYTGYDEYSKYPVETFFEKNGDCEDTSYLAASIIDAMDISSVLILLPGHMAVGVYMNCDTPGTYYKVDSKCYYYVETTSKDWSGGEIPDKYKYTAATLIKIPSGEMVNDISPQYIKPCYSSPDFPGYYYNDSNYYSDSRCNNLVYCVPYQEYYVNPQITTKLYWDSSCSQVVTTGCYKSTIYSGYFYNSIDLYSDSQCIQKATICRPSPNYSDIYYNGYNEFWDSSCTQKVVSWCSKSIYYPGYFYNTLDKEIYIDSQCTIKK